MNLELKDLKKSVEKHTKEAIKLQEMLTNFTGLLEQALSQPTEPAPPVPPQAPTPPAAPKPEVIREEVMTAKANGMTKEQFIGTGWTVDLLIENGYMEIVETVVQAPAAPAPPAAPKAPATPAAPKVPEATMSADEVNAKLNEEVKRIGDIEKVKAVIEKHNNGDWHLATADPSKYAAILADVKAL